MNIVGHRERGYEEMGYSVSKIGGRDDGDTFRMVEAQMNNGTRQWLWASNTRNGYFKQVFVPWDFNHPEIVDF